MIAFDKTLMDRKESVLHFDGEAALKTQQLRSKITADTKQFDLLDLHSPVLMARSAHRPFHSAENSYTHTGFRRR